MLVKGLERMKLIRVEVSINQFDLGFESEETFVCRGLLRACREGLRLCFEKTLLSESDFQAKNVKQKSQRFSLD